MKTSSRLNLPFWLIKAGLSTILPAAMLMLSAQTSMAGSATWLPSPENNQWGNANNWTTPPPGGSPPTQRTFRYGDLHEFVHHSSFG